MTWQERLAYVVDTMREVSRFDDPQELVAFYGQRMTGVLGHDQTISLSRRGLAPPLVRVTRNSEWERAVDPWLEQDALPHVKGGLLADLIYANQPRIIQDVNVPSSDPGHAHIGHARSLMAIPHYEGGESINMVLLASRKPNAFDPERLPDAVQTGNLFGRTTKNLHLAREMRRVNDALERELRAVQEIQMDLLPQGDLAAPGLDLAAHYQTSARAGGDYYDLFALPGKRTGLIVADVSGHGTPAAVLMAILHAIAHMMPGEPEPPARVLQHLNDQLATRYTRSNGSFVTALYALYEPSTRTLSYASAGHPPPLIRTRGGVARLDVDAGLPLGIAGGSAYAQAEVTLRPGDAVLLYTDGITEAFNPSREMYGEARLREAVRRAGRRDNRAVACCAEQIISEVIDDVGRFAGLASRDDDRTLLAVVAE